MASSIRPLASIAGAAGLAMLSLGTAVVAAGAADFDIADVNGGSATFRLSGMILPDDPKRIAWSLDAAARQFKDLTVELDSDGGDADAAMAIGRDFRKRRVRTAVPTDGEGCYSACVFILAGGAVRIAAAEPGVGIHRPSLTEAYFAEHPTVTPDQRHAAAAAGVKDYLAAMGMAPSLFEMMMQVPPDGMRLLTEAELRATGLSNGPSDAR